MNKIEKLHESIRTLFRSEGEKFCYTPGEIERLVCSLNYKQLYSVLCDMAEPVFTCCAGGGIPYFREFLLNDVIISFCTVIPTDSRQLCFLLHICTALLVFYAKYITPKCDKEAPRGG